MYKLRIICMLLLLELFVSCEENGDLITDDNTIDSIIDSANYIWNGRNSEYRVKTNYDDNSGFAGVWYINTDFKENEIGKSYFTWPSVNYNLNDDFFVNDYLCNNYGKCNGNITENGDFLERIIDQEKSINGVANIENGYSNPYLGIGFYIGGINHKGYNIESINGFCIEYSSSSDFLIMVIPENEYEVTRYDNFQCKLSASENDTISYCAWYDFKRENWSNFNSEMSIKQVLNSAELVEFHFKKSVSNNQIIFKIKSIGTLNGCKAANKR